jgi:hypothetical protein
MQGKTCLLEAVYSTMLTGENDHYWTVACLNDEYFNDGKLYADQQSDEDSLEDDTDPIIAKDGTKANEIMRSPRTYYLTALSVALKRIISYHVEVQDHLRASLDTYVSLILWNQLSLSISTLFHIPCLIIILQCSHS